ncbi:flagellar basal body P-ring formation chaperone FlgA [Pseudoduganella namucuonensis]|uniref:flagellar basal body P-ring formation chaperone FlgA n=1 Tax=Pseudoduganella namucuonensis TaxID=1035707 RepID=UPI001E2FE8EA|nr:flagellar basal body P-ring formation chaperone FlgA [Pseudoduganella namucuonensis]
MLERHAETAGWSDPVFELAAVRGARPIPPCGQAVTVETPELRQPSRVRLVAVCPGAEGWRYDFVVRAKITANVAVLAADIPAGRAVAAADVALRRTDISTLTETVSDLAALEGMSARRSLRNGEVLRQNMLVAMPLVKRGDAVRIVARREQIEVSMAGEALDTGARGALVRVRNVHGHVIRARVTGAGLVEPADMPISIQSPG